MIKMVPRESGGRRLPCPPRCCREDRLIKPLLKRMVKVPRLLLCILSLGTALKHNINMVKHANRLLYL